MSMLNIFQGQTPIDLRQKHVDAAKAKALEDMRNTLDRNGITLDELIDYIDSEPPTVADRVQAHRLKNVTKRRTIENAAKGRKAAADARAEKKAGKVNGTI